MLPRRAGALLSNLGVSFREANADSLAPSASELFIVRHVHDLELLGVQGWIGAEGELAEITLLHLNEVLLILGAEALKNGRMHHDPQLEVGLIPRAAS